MGASFEGQAPSVQDDGRRRPCQAGTLKYALPRRAGGVRAPAWAAAGGRGRRVVRAGRVGATGEAGMSFAGRTAVVTGASSGIGRALAVALAAQGARGGVGARRPDWRQALVGAVRGAGGRIEAAPADVADRPAVLAAVGELAGKLGPVDLLVANAGVGYPTGADPMNVPAVEHMTRVNF